MALLPLPPADSVFWAEHVGTQLPFGPAWHDRPVRNDLARYLGIDVPQDLYREPVSSSR